MVLPPHFCWADCHHPLLPGCCSGVEGSTGTRAVTSLLHWSVPQVSHFLFAQPYAGSALRRQGLVTVRYGRAVPSPSVPGMEHTVPRCLCLSVPQGWATLPFPAKSRCLSWSAATFPTQELRVRQGFGAAPLHMQGCDSWLWFLVGDEHSRASPPWKGRAFLSLSGQCFGVSHLCWSINLSGSYPRGNAENKSHVLSPQPWKGGVGGKLELLVLVGSWEAAQTLMGW